MANLIICILLVGIAKLTIDKIGFKIKDVNREGKGLFIMIKRSIHQERITTINIYKCT